MDDDCDGLIDEGLLNICGTCGEIPEEVCDGLDNDCDERVDEGTDSLEACGNDMGICEAGELMCINGEEMCQGEKFGTDEVCDCEDNDCDGMVDEEAEGDLCEGGQRCIGCECVGKCGTTVEFDPSCPAGLTPEDIEGVGCVCVRDECDRAACREETIERDDEVQCAPDNPDVARCRCEGGKCGALCDGKSCSSGEVCDRRTGVCVEDNCRGFGCPSDERCNQETGECEGDPCADADCGEDQVCRDGDCEPSCAAVVCDEGEKCESGECIEDKCFGSFCDEEEETCDPDSGNCVEDKCVGMLCDRDLVCEPVSGKCEVDACWNVTCPEDQRCVRGECTRRPTFTENFDDKPEDDGPRQRILATGGSACACSLPGKPEDGPQRPWLWGLVAGALVALRLGRRHRTRARILRASLTLTCLALALWLGGCKVTPYCVDCLESDDEENGDGDGDDNGDGDGDGDNVPDADVALTLTSEMEK
ncbi:MAG: hypothetical protein OXU20_04185 [Myxococcales bacterium]|nr:hypothetical protein [Myxococcales bacterium]